MNTLHIVDYNATECTTLLENYGVYTLLVTLLVQMPNRY
jgi:hypothetical protein